MNLQVSSPEDPRVDLARDRTSAAKFRTGLALDRATLAWIRTTLTMATFGFGMIGYFRTLEEKTGTLRSAQLHHGAVKFGTTLVVLGIAATVLSGISHWNSLRKLRRGEEVVSSQWPLSVTLAMLLAVLGLAGLWSALAH